MSRVSATVAASALAALLLAACGAGAAPGGPNSSPTPTVTPSPSETPEAPEPVAIVVEPERFVVVDSADEEVLVWAWEDEPVSIVDDLAIVLGAEPTVTRQEGDCCHLAAFDIYTWERFGLWIADLGAEPRSSYYLASFVEVTGPTAHGLDLRTRGGIQVGWTVSDALAASAPYHSATFDGVGYHWIEPVDPAMPLDSPDVNLTVLLVSGPDGGTVAKITAPASPQFP